MDKRTLLAVLLIFIVFWISSEFIWKRSQTTPEQQSVAETNTKEVPTETSDPVSAKTAEQEVVQSPEVIQTDIDITDDIILENEVMKLRFSNLGAVLHSIEIKTYLMADKETPVELLPVDETLLGTKLQMASGNISNLNNIPFQYRTEENKVVFTAITANGTIEKSFYLGEGYQVDMQVDINGNSELAGYELQFNSGITDTEEYLKMKGRDYKIVSQADNDLTKFTLNKLKEDRELNGKIDWAAIKSKYFTIVVIPEDLIDVNKLSAFKVQDSPAMDISIRTDRNNISHNYQMYFGPLIYSNLEAYGNGVTSVVEMGPKWLQWISRGFMIFLKFLNGLIPSWGIVLIIFSILLKIILYPLTHKSFESTTKMQRINPLVKEIQAKYKSDPQTMNAELKKLYKEHGVNPLGGCLPMLLQMPILFALYPMLRYSIDLRQTHFLWLPDLSEPDPIWALPILMAVFMFLQQKLMAPSQQNVEGMDEKQKAAAQSQKMMMYFMPIMMFFIFKGLSSGLVLYWTVFSVIGSVQQYFIKKKFN